MEGIQITTNRITLRDLLEDDLDSMCQVCLNPNITKYMNYIKKNSAEEVRTWLHETMEHNSAHPRFSYNLAIIEKATGEMIGWIGIGKPSDETKGDLDFGYAIIESYQGKGYGTEALRALIDFSFGLDGVHKIFG